LGLAMTIYVGDNNDTYAGAASANTYGPHLEDWIYWRTGANTPTVNGVLMTLQQSPLVKVLGTGGTTNMFRCPMDQYDQDRVNNAQAGDGPYFYSYEFNSYDLNGTINPGFTTIITTANQAYYFKSSQVHNPSLKMMVMEPVARLNLGSDEPACEPPSGNPTWVVQSGRWQAFGATPPYNPPCNNFLSIRHGNKSDSCFADGHTEMVGQNYATNYIYSLPTY
jgi:prepilin-type processing-associated H-X9-DG protein